MRISVKEFIAYHQYHRQFYLKYKVFILQHMYQNSAMEVAIATGNPVSQQGIEEALEKFENFYEDVFIKVIFIPYKSLRNLER